MEYVIGIDGGGTKTLLKIADLKGNMLVQLERADFKCSVQYKRNIKKLQGHLSGYGRC